MKLIDASLGLGLLRVIFDGFNEGELAGKCLLRPESTEAEPEPRVLRLAGRFCSNLKTGALNHAL